MFDFTKKRFISIKVKISILTSAVAVFCLFIISFVFLYNSKILMQKRTIEICRNFAENISNVAREDLVLDATYESTNSVVGEIIKSEIEGLQSIYIVNVYGKFVVNFNKTKLEDSATEKEILYLKNIQSLDLQEVYLKETNQNVLKITYPIFINYNEQNLKIGAAIFEYDRDKIYQPIYEMQNKIILIGMGITIFTLIFTLYVSNYITRPIVLFSKGVQMLASGVLEHKIVINSHDEVGLLSEKFNEMSNNLRQSYEQLEEKVLERTAELNASLNVIRKDLAIAEKIQKTTLSSNLDQHNDLEIIIKYVAMTEVGGDFYCVNKLGESTSRIFLADATGHGVQAALIMMAIQGIYDGIKNFALPVNEVLEIFNREFSRRYGSLNTFLTCIILDVDTSDFVIRYASAGHPAGLLINKEKDFLLLSKTGPLIGAKPNCKYAQVEYPFNKEERIFVYTDGIFEEFYEEEEFGEDRLIKFLIENKDNTIESSIDNLLRELTSFLKTTTMQDDVTILGIGYTAN
ncbi:MAG: SpoIIE family protein phosphatase [Leptospiraceae bacterium]|nr:SpoIIE family protein phosphatase [Leptospiraceae bacterium]MBL0263988.1 SpoIIE family protein phosphatase [Leptospiraceae bacterium]